MMHLQIFPQDSWCFREARPTEALGGMPVASTFPPPAHTVVGALRHLLGSLDNVDWRQPDQYQWLGDEQQTGDLSFSFPAVVIQQNGTWQRLFPVPAFLLRAKEGLEEGNRKACKRQQLRKTPTETDLGNIRLHVPEPDFEPVTDAWLTPAGWQALANGREPAPEEFIPIHKLIGADNRIGIAKNQTTGATLDEALFELQYLSFQNGATLHGNTIEQIGLAVSIEGVPQRLQLHLEGKTLSVRFGGEGRLATVVTQECPPKDPAMSVPQMSDFKPPGVNKRQLKKAQKKASSARQVGLTEAIMVMLSPGDFGCWLPPGFKKIEKDGFTQWQGRIGNQEDSVTVSILGYSADRPLKQGGWDSAKRCPKPVRSLVPSGASYFIECDELQRLATLLQTTRLGAQTGFGLGQAVLLPANSKKN